MFVSRPHQAMLPLLVTRDIVARFVMRVVPMEACCIEDYLFVPGLLSLLGKEAVQRNTGKKGLLDVLRSFADHANLSKNFF